MSEEIKKVKVTMKVKFEVPKGKQPYKGRTDGNVLPWKTYAEHDMIKHLKNIDELPDYISENIDMGGVSFEWSE
jgi:hypothetical protein